MPDKVFRLFIDVDSTKGKRGAREAGAAMRRLEDRVNLVSKALVLAGVAVAGIAFAKLIRGSIDAAVSFQRWNSALKVATGSAAGARVELAFLIEQAERLGLPLRESADAFAKLSAAARGTALEGNSTRQIFLGVSEAATALGLTAEQTGGALTAIEQIISKGKVSAEELRGQLGERLPGAFQVAARAIGVTTAELDKMLATGRLTAEDFLPSFAAELRKTFGRDAVSAAENAQQQFNRFNTAVLLLQQSIGEQLAPAIGNMATVLSDLARDESAHEFFRSLGAVIADILNVIASALSSFDQLKSAILQFTADSARALAGFYNALAQIFLDIAVAINKLPDALLAISPELQNLRNQGAAFAVAFATSRDSLLDFADTAETAAADALNLDRATRQVGRSVVANLSTPLSQGSAALSEAEEAAKAFREELEQSSLDQFTDRIEKLARAMNKLGTEMLDVSGIDLTVGLMGELPTAEDLFGDFDAGGPIDWEGFSDRMSQAIANAFASGDVDSAIDGLVNALGAGISDIVSQTVSGALATSMPGLGAFLGPIAGGVAGGLFTSLFGDDDDEKLREMQQAFEELVDTIRSSMPAIRQEVIATAEAIMDILRLVQEAGRATGEEMAAIERELTNVIESISGVAVEDFGARLRAANELLETIGRMDSQVQEIFETLGFSLESLADSVVAEFLGITSHIELGSLAVTANDLAHAIRGLGLEADQTSRLIRIVRQEEKLRAREIRAGVLNELAGLLERAGIRSAEAARLRAQFEQIQFQVALKRLEVELRMLDMWSQFTAQLFRELTQFASNIENFMQGAAGALSQTIPTGPLRVGGRRGGRGGRRQERRSLLEELERLMNPVDTSTFAGRLRELNNQFDELRKRARKLKVPLDKVNAAYRVQLALLREQALSSLTSFRDELLQGPSPRLDQQFFNARSQFFALARRAQAGDLDAISQLASSGRAFLDLARQMFGSTARFDQIFNEVLGLVNGIVSGDQLSMDEGKAQHAALLDKLSVTDSLQTDFHNESQQERRAMKREMRETVRQLREANAQLGRIEAA